MQAFGERTRQLWVLLLMIVAAFVLLHKMADYTVARLHLTSSHSGYLKVYWTTAQESNWSESRSRALYVNDRKQRYLLALPVKLTDIAQLRVDPNANPGVTNEIKSLGLYNLHSESIVFKGRSALRQLQPNEHIGELKQGKTLRFISTGNDPQLLASLSENHQLATPWLMLVQSILLGLIGWGLFRYLPWLLEDMRWVPAGMLIAASAVLAMSLVSAYNKHPDEVVHIKNAGYYQNHYPPPEVCADQAKYTYSVYGVSRLNNREIAYVVGGRYLELVNFIPAPDYLKLRLLNVLLLFMMVLLAFRQPGSRLLFLPLLLTPQAWYLFSYYNSDALSLFAVVIAAYQVFVPASILRRLLKGERPPGWVLWVLGLAVLVALQFWVKLNYVFYPLFLAMLAFAWLLLNRRLPDMHRSLPVLVSLALGVSMFLGWEISRHAVNDFQLGSRISECQEIMAGPEFKPSTPLEETHYNVRLREKGYSLEHVLFVQKWPERIFFTGLGAYGYTEFLNSYYIYKTASFFIVLLLLYVLVTVSIRGDGMARMAVLATLASIVGVALAALWVNWTKDFQPQGRYLMVYLPLLGSLMAMYANLLNRTVLSMLAAVPFGLALYSFFAVGLVEIPKS